MTQEQYNRLEKSILRYPFTFLLSYFVVLGPVAGFQAGKYLGLSTGDITGFMFLGLILYGVMLFGVFSFEKHLLTSPGMRVTSQLIALTLFVTISGVGLIFIVMDFGDTVSPLDAILVLMYLCVPIPMLFKRLWGSSA